MQLHFWLHLYPLVAANSSCIFMHSATFTNKLRVLYIELPPLQNIFFSKFLKIAKKELLFCKPAFVLSLVSNSSLRSSPRAKILQGSANFWRGTDSANDRSLLTRQNIFCTSRCEKPSENSPKSPKYPICTHVYVSFKFANFGKFW